MYERTFDCSEVKIINAIDRLKSPEHKSFLTPFASFQMVTFEQQWAPSVADSGAEIEIGETISNSG